MSKTVLFISVFNSGGTELALNHLQSLKRQNIENYKAYATDKQCYDTIFQNGFNVELITHDETKYIIQEKTDFGTTEFNTLSYLRYKIIEDLLSKGQPVWYLDIDTVVLQNLNDVYDELKDLHYDMVMQDDITMLCTGCMLLFPNDTTIKMMKSIYYHRSKHENDQIILRRLLSNKKNVINIFKLNAMQFPNGLLFFNELSDYPKYRKLQLAFTESVHPIYFVHANWMVGMKTKIDAFKRKGLWFI